MNSRKYSLLFLSLILCVAQIYGSKRKCLISSKESLTAIEPCPTNDVYCISGYFNCPVPRSPTNLIIKFEEMKVSLPYFNLTITQSPIISGLESGKMQNLTVDIQRSTVSYVVEFNNVWINATSLFEYHKTGAVFYTETSEFYRRIVTKTEIRSLDTMDADDGDTYVEIPHFPDHYSYGQCVKTKDPTLKALFAEIAGNPTIAISESFLSRGTLMVEYFTENYVCDQ